MQQIARWVLVADASRALLFRSGQAGIVLKQEFDHPDSRAKVSDIMADSAGRKPAAALPGGGVGAAPSTDAKRVEAEKFARELAAHLKVHVDHDQAPLVLVAAPQFLGLLRNSMTAQVAKRVERSIDKDLTSLGPHELVARLKSALSN